MTAATVATRALAGSGTIGRRSDRRRRRFLVAGDRLGRSPEYALRLLAVGDSAAATAASPATAQAFVATFAFGLGVLNFALRDDDRIGLLFA
jgi:hypothetical protein